MATSRAVTDDRRRRAGAGAGVAALAVAAGAAGFAIGRGDGEATAGTEPAPTATTRIERQDLVETDTVDGTLGYSDARPVVNRLPGTVTWTPKAGSVVRVNRTLYEVDGRRVYTLEGLRPAYRALGPGLTGPDVRQLERSLRALRYDRARAMRVDGTWDAGTTAAVRRWQRAKGMDDTGVIPWGRVVFQPGTRRVGTVVAPGLPAAAPGGPGGPGEGQQPPPLMTTTSTKRIVTVDLKTTQSELAERGARVRVEMPDGERVAGTIVRVGRIARRRPSNPEETEPPATIKLIVRLRRGAGAGLDQAPVDVDLESRRARGVLTIPVTALLARQGGAFAIEVREGDRRRIVPVRPGLYTDGDVEITGAGLRAGMTVTDAKV